MLEHERLQEVYVPGRGNCFPLAFSCAMAAAGKNCAWEETREAAAFGHETHKAKTVQGGRIWADYVLQGSTGVPNMMSERKRRNVATGPLISAEYNPRIRLIDTNSKSGHYVY